MDPEAIARLVEEMRLSKTDEESRVVIEWDVVRRETDRRNLCLLVKVFVNKPTNRELFRQKMPQILNLSKPVEVEMVGENLFIMEFKSTHDRCRTLMEGPRNFFWSLVPFQEIRGLQNPSDNVFESINIWVQMHNLPIAFMNRRVLEVIGGKVGKVLEIDEGEGGNYWG